MDSLSIDLVKQFINEAFRQSPSNSEGGYQFAMGTLALVCLLLIAGFGFYYRDQKRERRSAETDRKQARDSASKQIDGRFDRLEGAINTDLDEFRKEVAIQIGALQGKHADFREELARLRTVVEFIQKSQK